MKTRFPAHAPVSVVNIMLILNETNPLKLAEPEFWGFGVLGGRGKRSAIASPNLGDWQIYIVLG
jgi:hypothetical protein